MFSQPQQGELPAGHGHQNGPLREQREQAERLPALKLCRPAGRLPAVRWRCCRPAGSGPAERCAPASTRKLAVVSSSSEPPYPPHGPLPAVFQQARVKPEAAAARFEGRAASSGSVQFLGRASKVTFRFYGLVFVLTFGYLTPTLTSLSWQRSPSHCEPGHRQGTYPNETERDRT